ncbi:hypothetical protein MKW94_014724 [Papaver nudicaule]|uniref:GATA-type domain-containing protein n=1 Tax=Papaver nudicaule TaxID=74823 RepID=A0AA41S0U3_PAPNU|nr:hypothetical protein [Papaver nudicaule]
MKCQFLGLVRVFYTDQLIHCGFKFNYGTDLWEELRRLHYVVLKLSAEIGGKNQKLEYLEKNVGLMKELETQRKEIEQQAKEIEKRYAQLDLKSMQLLVLKELNTATRASRKLNTVQVQIDTNSFPKELEEKDSELDNELNRKQNLVGKETGVVMICRRHAKFQSRKEEVKKGDDEKSIDLIGDWGKGDIGGSGVECNAFQDMFPPLPPPEFLADMCNDMPYNSSDLSSVLPIPDDEIADMEWLLTLDENYLSAGGITLDIDFSNNSKKDDLRQLGTSNPVSVLENSSSCSGGKTLPLSLDSDTVVPGRVRSKRPRSVISYQQPTQKFISPKSCITNVQNLPVPNSCISSKSDYFAEFHPPHAPKFNGKEQKRKMKRLRSSLPSYSSDHDNPLQQQQQQPGVAVQKCPMGPETLCNACGLRYKSGRLFPEYRPATSPTFVASLHSNSHKKVLEMKVTGTPESDR